jgi:hypothetical protein
MHRNARSLSALTVAVAVFLSGLVATAEADTLFKNENPSPVRVGVPPGGNPQFTLAKNYTLESIYTYHFNGGQGKPAGQIWLLNAAGQKYGPWVAGISSKVYWVVKPGILLAPGTYTICDSDPASWSFNAGSKNQGFAQVYGVVVDLNAVSGDDTKGRVDNLVRRIGTLQPADRAAAVETLNNDVKGPVQIRLSPTAFTPTAPR